MRSIFISIQLISIFLLWNACSDSSSSTDVGGLSYEQIISDAWSLFDDEQYQLAMDRFKDAQDMSGDESGAYTGQGCVYFVLDKIDSSAYFFSLGEDKKNLTATHYAIWAFVLNIEKQYLSSLEKGGLALEMNPNWNFPYGLNLNSYDLHLLNAINYFLIGAFEDCLIEIQILDPFFNTDVNSNSGQIALSEELEKLKRN